MYKSFQSLEELAAYVKTDKEWEGAEATIRNRYPIRFILFENFADFYEFIINRPDGIYQFAIQKMVDDEYPDIFPTFTSLSEKIREHVKGLPAHDYVIYPFSEMTRFYDSREFLSLVKTIRGYQPSEEAQMAHIRLYIPIVGMQGKMGKFMADHQTFVWEYKSSAERGVYDLILTNGTDYGISGLERRYSVVNNLSEWLRLWEQGEDVRKQIICTSPNIFRNAVNAQPDNAFRYIECRDAHEFLTRGLGLDFGGIQPLEEDRSHWETLAKTIDLETFDFDSFINERFDTFEIRDGRGFIKTWFECESDFDRWLLAMYYRKISGGRGYICRVLSRCSGLSTTELFSNIAACIFESPFSDDDIHERRAALKEANRRNVKITEIAERQVYAKLSAMACGAPEDRYTAIRLMTSLTDSDRRLVVELLGKGVLSRAEIERIYPELYHYLGPLGVQLQQSQQWIGKYFECYRAAKMSGDITAVAAIIAEKNGDQASFQHWNDGLKTVKTLLHNRPDIDKYYWIDGLGVDWVPFIADVIHRHNMDNVYLNEVYIARAALPTTTSANRPKLEQLLDSDERLEKIGDLDSFAHQHKPYPQYIIEELRIVEGAIHKVLSQYNGKKIAFVSDHGMTYLAQYGAGLNLAGVDSDHEGRTGVATGPAVVTDNKYCILDDGRTLCSLTHDSLTSKTPKGHGAHGGATPEEVLVPVIIVSSQPNASAYSAELLSYEVDGTNPKVRLVIRGLNSVDVPMVEYNNLMYQLFPESDGTYVSERLNLVDTATSLTLIIGDYTKSFRIKISTGAEEDDLFSDF